MYSLLTILIFLATLVFTYQYPEGRSFPNYLTPPANYNKYVLPVNLNPVKYDLTLYPHLSENTFSGEIKITIGVLVATNLIVIHANPSYISVTNSTIQSVSQPVSISDHQTNQTYELLTFTLNETLTADQNVTLTIFYEGIFGEDMFGFYLSNYNTSTGPHLIGITQLGSTSARRAFPCFDEPAYRAPFSISIWHTADQITMSNMNIRSQSDPNPTTGLILDTYEVTPPIPTYLVAFGVTDKDFGVLKGGDMFRVFAREAVINDSTYVVQMGQSILDTISNYTGVNYSLPKIDAVALPDFIAKAMQNWGLPTFREMYILYNPSKNSLRDKFAVLSEVVHELSHQWFGDLVTAEWWSYAWLNEAFATYFEYTIPNQLEPSWELGSTMYVVGAVQYALDLDVGSPRPMTADVWTPSQIGNIYDYVTYEKGASVLRMVENFLTADVWKKGLNNYLIANENGVGTPEKLFSALIEGSQDPTTINNTLKDWTTQPGYPVITVTTSQVGNKNITYLLSQMPYALSNGSNYTWNVPVVYTSQSQCQFDPVSAPRHWYYPSDPSSRVLTVDDDGWLLLNVDQIGYYRVNYDAANWAKLKSQLDSNFTRISEINRAQIVDDAFHLAQTGHMDYATTFGLTNYLPEETALAPWNAYFVNMRFLINIYYNTPTGDGLQEYARRTMLPPFNFLLAKLGPNKDNFLFTTTVAAAGLFSCEVGLSECRMFAKNAFDIWRNNSSYEIPPFVKQTVLCTGLEMEPTVETFLEVWKFYLSSDNDAEKRSIMYAMGCVTNTTAINIYLDSVTDTYSNYVRLEDRGIAFQSLAGHQTGVIPVLQYLTTNYIRCINALGSRISVVIATISEMITQESQITYVKSILNNASVDQRLKDQLISVVIPAIAQREMWISTPQASSLSQWIDNYVNSSAPYSVINITLVLVSALIILLK
uniref:Aminopeptidase n=1 Tax=Cuerna arida TaxID=1464854 RepID=A0A1B6ENK7_9HEMI